MGDDATGRVSAGWGEMLAQLAVARPSRI